VTRSDVSHVTGSDVSDVIGSDFITGSDVISPRFFFTIVVVQNVSFITLNLSGFILIKMSLF
jgi:hypothetical protein